MKVALTRRQVDMMYPPATTRKQNVIKQQRERRVTTRLSKAADDVMKDPTATIAERVVAQRYRLQQNRLPRPTKVERKARRANLKEAKRVRRMGFHKADNVAKRATKEGGVDWSNADSLLAKIPEET